jgi:hypothetical protein
MDMGMRSVELSGDNILAKIKEIQTESITTPRMPDVRIVVKNNTDAEITFRNPGKHSDNDENIPPGEACMVMVRGDNLGEQFKNAQELVSRANLAGGLTAEFVKAMASGDYETLLKEAYGPAPFDKQAKQLQELVWKDANGTETKVTPIQEGAVACGARPPTNEEVYKLELSHPGLKASLKGTNTVAENFQEGSIFIAVSSDWQTGAIITKPIAPKIAETFYGEHYDNIPTFVVNRNGSLTKK